VTDRPTTAAVAIAELVGGGSELLVGSRMAAGFTAWLELYLNRIKTEFFIAVLKRIHAKLKLQQCVFADQSACSLT
jgi:hypothetical protein